MPLSVRETLLVFILTTMLPGVSSPGFECGILGIRAVNRSKNKLDLRKNKSDLDFGQSVNIFLDTLWDRSFVADLTHANLVDL